MSQTFNPRAVAVLGHHDGTAGQIQTWFADATGLEIVCYIHVGRDFSVDPAAENARRQSQRTEYPEGGRLFGRPFVVTEDWVEAVVRHGADKVLLLTADNRKRLAQIELCRAAGLSPVSAIHPSARILDKAEIAPGVWINAGSLIGYKTEIASGVLINTGAQIDHHNILRPCCQVDPGVVTAGYVTFDECSHVHTGAVVINRLTVGHDAVVGAGAVVIRDVPPHETVVGVPARRLLRR